MRTDGRYEGRITINDKRKSFYGRTKSEIKQKARDYIQDVNNGYKEPQRIKFGDYIEYWMKTYKWNKIEPSSYTRLYRVYECQIKDTIGGKYIGDIMTKDIQELVDQYANPTNSDVKPLSYSGLKRLIHLINPCLNQAVEENIISSNPCKNVILPKESCMAVETKKQYSLNDNEIEQLKNACLEKYKTGEYKSRDAFVILLILNLGLRAGEALALEWNDFDFKNGIVHIHKTIQSNIKNFNPDVERRTYNKIKNSTKTYAGMRVLKLSPITLQYIKRIAGI